MTMKNPSLLGNDINRPSKTLLLLLPLLAQSGCAVVAVADAAVTLRESRRQQGEMTMSKDLFGLWPGGFSAQPVS